ncbi:glycosyltransferase family 2 protein [Pelobium manganitolerans]|uniref:glycosyltransferase family 2 protein n=1 Tax=Pelobium manganitolerans TaxID=1842495 RepID=UPI003FA35956
MDLVSVITVNYNQPEATVALLHSLKKVSYPNLEVILVDNGSTENNEATFQDIFPNFTFIRTKVNLGFAGGNNLGIKAAKGEYIFLLNNDTEVTENTINQLVDVLKNNIQIGLLSPLILYYDKPDTVQYAGYTPLNYLTARNQQLGQYEENVGQYDQKTYPTGFCHGAAVICRKSDLNKAGLMDENYFLYYEELDWCEKFKRIGKQIYFTGNTYILHKESVSVGKESPLKTYFLTRNRMLFIRKNTSLLNTIGFSVYYLLVACPKMVLKYLLNRRSDLALQVIKAVKWNLFHSKNSKNLGYKLK